MFTSKLIENYASTSSIQIISGNLLLKMFHFIHFILWKRLIVYSLLSYVFKISYSALQSMYNKKWDVFIDLIYCEYNYFMSGYMPNKALYIKKTFSIKIIFAYEERCFKLGVRRLQWWCSGLHNCEIKGSCLKLHASSRGLAMSWVYPVWGIHDIDNITLETSL